MRYPPDVETASIVSFQVVDGVAVARVTAPTVGEREGGVIFEEAQGVSVAAGGRYVFDLSQVTMIASAGLGTLIRLASTARSAGGKLVLFGLNDSLRQLIAITKLDKVLTIVDDETKALKKAKA